MEEVWKEITGYPQYQVSNLGRIRSAYNRGGGGGRATLSGTWRIIKPSRNKSGHLGIKLRAPDGTTRVFYVHVLVLTAFVGPKPVGCESLHWDDNPANNVVTNLRWGTKKDNRADQKRNGHGNAGVRHGMAKLNDDMVREIRVRCERGELQRVVAESLGIARQSVSKVVRRDVWSHVS